MGVFRHSIAALTATAAAPLGVLGLAVRPAWRQGLDERLGGGDAGVPGAIWVHGASVGEIQAATRLVDCLRARGHAVLTSTTTTTGRALMRAARPDIPCRLAPLDHPWCVDRALSRLEPAALVLIETELWPTWISGCARRDVPVLLVSGRISDRSFPRYRRVAPALRRTFGRIAAIGARSGLDRERFLALGAEAERVTVTGDLKLETAGSPPPTPADLADALRGVPTLVAGSTHPGEEAAALEGLAELERAGQRAALVLAPRRTSRAAEILSLAREAGRSARRRSKLGSLPLAPGEVLVLDTLGELRGVLAQADVAFVGGTLVPVGGHNLLEPIEGGRPVLFGPHTEGVRHVAAILEACGAGQRVTSGRDLGAAAARWLADPAEAARLGAAGREALRDHRGSAERAAVLVESSLSAARAKVRG